MALYEYTCDNIHTHDVSRSMDERDAPLACPTCAAPTRRSINRSVNTTLREGQRKASDGTSGFRVHVKGANRDFPEVACTGCAWTDTVVVEGDAALPACPECGAATKRVMGVPTAESMLQFPRYDKGLGLVLESEAHRRRVMKERGLVEAGDYDEDRIMSAIEREQAEDTKVFDDYVDRLENSPEYRDFRILRDKGRYDSVLKREPDTMIEVQNINRPRPLKPNPLLKKRRVVG